MPLPETQIPKRDLSISGCRSLWLSVIQGAIDDLHSTDERERMRAYAWIFSPLFEDGFKRACDGADVEPAWIRDRIREAKVVGMIKHSFDLDSCLLAVEAA